MLISSFEESEREKKPHIELYACVPRVAIAIIRDHSFMLFRYLKKKPCAVCTSWFVWCLCVNECECRSFFFVLQSNWTLKSALNVEAKKRNKKQNELHTKPKKPRQEETNCRQAIASLSVQLQNLWSISCKQ